MGVKTERFGIEGDEYELTQLGGVESLGLFHELRKMVLPHLGNLFGDTELVGLLSGSTKPEDLDVKMAAKLVALVVNLFQSMPRTLEAELATAFAANSKVRIGEAMLPLSTGGLTKGSVFDQHFGGRMSSYQKWLLASLKFNFAGFLGGSGS
jgi:hypothetical protein